MPSAMHQCLFVKKVRQKLKISCILSLMDNVHNDFLCYDITKVPPGGRMMQVYAKHGGRADFLRERLMPH